MKNQVIDLKSKNGVFEANHELLKWGKTPDEFIDDEEKFLNAKEIKTPQQQQKELEEIKKNFKIDFGVSPDFINPKHTKINNPKVFTESSGVSSNLLNNVANYSRVTNYSNFDLIEYEKVTEKAKNQLKNHFNNFINRKLK